MNFPLLDECYTCSKRRSAVKFIPLTKDKSELAIRLIELTKKEPFYCQPTVACRNCLKKLTLIEYHLNLHPTSEQISLNAISNNRMAEGHEQKKTDQGQGTMTTCSNDYNCSCVSCQNKFGSLPLLLRVIEQRALVRTTPERDSPSHSLDYESEPSTSSGVRLNPSSSLPFVCQYCSKSFSHKGDFNKHLRKHTKEQPYTCEVCDRKFAHTSNLHRHLRLHTGQKPYVCKNCDKSFSRKDKLESHKKSRLCQKMSKS